MIKNQRVITILRFADLELITFWSPNISLFIQLPITKSFMPHIPLSALNKPKNCQRIDFTDIYHIDNLPP
jgi:hypothetical protein